ncbi:hypothetical protein FQV37_1331 [Psychrobacter nivimaris]|uniref:Uncharacterized protein n=1 Tax=Psychrobacter nivimaris TaxID=281738 RepID=A0A6N7C086_9GAMM|nr:hypothetical protein FQV37_1331 [Psychrobacter nivimaris]
MGIKYKFLQINYFLSKGIPQGNQLFHSSNVLIDHLKQTAIMEPLITDCNSYPFINQYHSLGTGL